MKKIISKEINSLVHAAYEEAANNSFTISTFEQFNVPCGFCLGIGRVQVVNANGPKSYLILAPEIKKDYMQAWKKDIGNIFIQDCKKNNLSEYYKFETSKFTVLLRKVLENEYTELKDADYTFVHLGDFYYVVIKYMTTGQRFSQIDMTDDYLEIPVKEVEEDEEEQEEPEIESISLF